MTMTRGIRLLSLLLLIPSSLYAFSEGPWTGNNGTPPFERTCAVCHDSYALNSGPATLEWNVPEEYEPGQTYTLEVVLSDTAAIRWGFQFAALYDEIEQAGEFTLTDTVNTQVLHGFNPNPDENNGDFVEHTLAGTYLNVEDQVSWSFDWTAPDDAVEELIFYLAGNAANGDFTSSGDYIYTLQQAAYPVNSAGEENAQPLPGDFAITGVYPNPFNSSTTVQVYSPTASELTVNVYNLLGREVASLTPVTAEPGSNAIAWRPESGSGIYLLAVRSRDGWTGHAKVMYVR